MIYFDTAYLAKCYLNENGSKRVREFAQEHNKVACCAFGRLELVSTFHRHFCDRQINDAQRRVVLRQLKADETDHLWTWLPVTLELLMETADALSRLRSSIRLRAADALHLVCARTSGFKVVYTNDRHLLGAGEGMGLEVRNILSDD